MHSIVGEGYEFEVYHEEPHEPTFVGFITIMMDNKEDAARQAQKVLSNDKNSNHSHYFIDVSSGRKSYINY